MALKEIRKKLVVVRKNHTIVFKSRINVIYKFALFFQPDGVRRLRFLSV